MVIGKRVNLKRVFQENKARQIFQKTNFSYPLIRTYVCVLASTKYKWYSFQVLYHLPPCGKTVYHSFHSCTENIYLGVNIKAYSLNQYNTVKLTNSEK